MASGIFAILDDISILMDDVVVMSKIATKKTAGILGDDLAVNTEKSTGFVSSRELPVLWAITKGSFVNKLIILPLVFLLNYFVPEAVTIILILGGLYLAYEGAEKIVHFLISKFYKKNVDQHLNDNADGDEKVKIKSAIKTDFILSLEIVIIALSTVLEKSLLTQILVVSIVALIATVGVYGIVALLVRIDDFGFLLQKNASEESIKLKIGQFLINLLPKVIKSLSLIGTIALILVSGGIFVHNIHAIEERLPQFPVLVNEFIVGLVVGSLVVLIVTIVHKILPKTA